MESFHFLEKYCRFGIVICKLGYKENLWIDVYSLRIFHQYFVFLNNFLKNYYFWKVFIFLRNIIDLGL